MNVLREIVWVVIKLFIIYDWWENCFMKNGWCVYLNFYDIFLKMGDIIIEIFIGFNVDF